MTNQPTTPAQDDKIGLPRLSAEYLALTGQPGYGYRRFYYLASNGELPTIYERGKYFVRRSDLMKVAAICGVVVEDCLEEA
jgi:hypothetical protein